MNYMINLRQGVILVAFKDCTPDKDRLLLI